MQKISEPTSNNKQVFKVLAELAFECWKDTRNTTYEFDIMDKPNQLHTEPKSL